MIPIDVLRAVRRCVVHANCADGKASAVILHAALPNAEIVEVAHDSREHLTMAAEPGLLFCDFTPHVSRVAEFVAAGAIVLDHHKGAEAVVKAFGERGAFADEKTEPGVSGAALALREVLIPIGDARSSWVCEYPDAAGTLAQLIGIRDTWQRSSPFWDEACAVSAAVRFLPLDDALKRGPVGVLAFARDVGPLLMRKQLDAAKDAATNAVRVIIGGRRVAIVSSSKVAEDACDIIGSAADFVAGFDYIHDARGVRLKWSLRSRGDVDVSAIARRHGGNGHTAAAGFSVVVVDDTGEMVRQRNPYLYAEELLGAA